MKVIIASIFLLLFFLLLNSCKENITETQKPQLVNKINADWEPSPINFATLNSEESYEIGSYTITSEDFTVIGSGSTNWRFYLYGRGDNIEDGLEYYMLRVKRNGFTVKTRYITNSNGLYHFFNINDIGVGVTISLEIVYYRAINKRAASLTSISTKSTCFAFLEAPQ